MDGTMALFGFICIQVKPNGGFALVSLRHQSGFLYIFSFSVLKQNKKKTHILKL